LQSAQQKGEAAGPPAGIGQNEISAF